MFNRAIKVLIIDDSIFFRNFINEGITGENRIQVVGMAGDVFEARDKILELEPDVLTLDIEMPQMDGIEFLEKLMPQYPLPTVVISCHGERMLKALEAGAVDFMKKPVRNDKESMKIFLQELIVKIKIASMANVSAYKSKYLSKVMENPNGEKIERLIAIGASTGGTEAVLEIVRNLPRNMPGIVVVQHMPEGFTQMYANRLNELCRMEAKEAKTGDLVLPGRILIAPGGQQMRVARDKRGLYAECFNGDLVNGHKPSVDVLFHSVAGLLGEEAVGVILTGMGYDGAKGIRAMKQAGSHTIGQDEDTCVVYGMPKVAYDIGGVAEVLPLQAIAQRLYALSHL